MTYKTRVELLRAAADAIEMQEKAGIAPECKINGDVYYIRDTLFSDDPKLYEFPLAVVEGKPVFVGDKLYRADGSFTFASVNDTEAMFSKLLWSKPKPKTVMVELPVELVKFYATADSFGAGYINEACRKALEAMK